MTPSEQSNSQPPPCGRCGQQVHSSRMPDGGARARDLEKLAAIPLEAAMRVDEAALRLFGDRY